MSIDFARLDPSLLAPATRAVKPTDHFVELYDDDSSLVDSVRTFLAMGLANGDAAVIIAAPAHREAIEAALAHSIDLDGARAQGVYVALDAAETLARFMDGDRPDSAKFHDVVGGLVGSAQRAGKGVRLFGEMVAVLWEAGNAEGAIQLEDLWNRLSEEHPFRLFCAYPATGFDEATIDGLSMVCHHHSHVLVPRAAAV